MGKTKTNKVLWDQIKKEFGAVACLKDISQTCLYDRENRAYVGLLVEREDGLHYTPHDINFERWDIAINNIEDLCNAVSKYKEHFERYGITSEAGDEILSDGGRMGVALDDFMRTISAKRKQDKYCNTFDDKAMCASPHKEIFVYNDRVDRDSKQITVNIQLSDGRLARKEFGNIVEMLKWVSNILNFFLLPFATEVAGAINQISKLKLGKTDLNDVVLDSVDAFGGVTETVNFKDFMIERLEEAIRTLKQE